MFLATTTAANGGVMSTGMLIMWLVIMFGMMYFLMIRPQKKEQKKLQAMLNDLAVGDAVVTTSGFYGVVIDITFWRCRRHGLQYGGFQARCKSGYPLLF